MNQESVDREKLHQTIRTYCLALCQMLFPEGRRSAKHWVITGRDGDTAIELEGESAGSVQQLNTAKHCDFTQYLMTSRGITLAEAVALIEASLGINFRIVAPENKVPPAGVAPTTSPSSPEPIPVEPVPNTTNPDPLAAQRTWLTQEARLRYAQGYGYLEILDQLNPLAMEKGLTSQEATEIILGATPPDKPNPAPQPTAQAQAAFIPSTKWQDVPDWAVLPNGGHYRLDPNSAACQARWDEPVPAPELVKDKRKLARPESNCPGPPLEHKAMSEPILPQHTRDYLAHGAAEGQRNSELFQAACQMRDASMTQIEAEALLIPRAVSDGLSAAEIDSTICSAFARVPRAPIYAKNGEPLPRRQASPAQEAKSAPTQPQPLPSALTDGLRLLLTTCFLKGECVAISDTKLNANGEPKPGTGDCYSREAWLKRLQRDPISQVYPKARDGLFIRINPITKKGKTDKDVTALRHCLVEFDLDAQGKPIPKQLQYAMLLKSNLPISVLLDSGNKSLHAWIPLDAPDRAEYDRRRQIVWEYFQKTGLPLDPQNKNPSRYSRCPGAQRNLYDTKGKLTGTGHQELLAVRLGLPSWQQWEKAQIEADYTDQELAQLEQIQRQKYRVKDRPFPVPMEPEAFYGIAGQIVKIIEPLTEASPESILSQLLIAFGNCVGRGPYRKQAGIHHLNEFMVLIGPTARGRKGTAWNAIQNLLAAIDQHWLADRIKDGLQSGEAIVHAVRDEITAPVPMHKRKAGHAQGLQMAVLDPGVTDKRLLLLEEEFGRLLTVAARTGNTLSSTLRKCWDANQWLHVEGKVSPEKATGAHVSMIGHVTLMELLQCLNEIENRNGFSNRVLWVATRRTKKIPLPGWINWKKTYPKIVVALSKILSDINAVPARQMDWSPQGNAAWQTFYTSIPEADAGILGPIIARSDAHVLRLTMLYAILDASCLMTQHHLRAAIAFWQYCQRSAQWAFAEKTGNKMADRIFWALQHEPNGMTRQQIREECFSDHCSKTTLDLAFASLQEANLVNMKLERSKQAKKPTERWFAKV